MTSSTAGAVSPAPAVARPGARPGDLIAAEWIKLRSLRSTSLVLLAAVAAALGIGLLVCNSDASQWTHVRPGQPLPIDPLSDAFVGFAVAQLMFASLGALTMTGEYSSGLIRTTFAAVPPRGAVLAAKATVTAAVSFAVGLVTALVTFLAAQAVLSGSHLGIPLSHPGVVRAILAAALFLTSVTLIGLGLGALIRHPAGAIGAAVVLLFLAPSFLHGTSRWMTGVTNALPDSAIRRLISLHPWPHAPSITESVIVMIAYPAVALAWRPMRLRRRDA